MGNLDIHKTLIKNYVRTAKATFIKRFSVSPDKIKLVNSLGDSFLFIYCEKHIDSKILLFRLDMDGGIVEFYMRSAWVGIAKQLKSGNAIQFKYEITETEDFMGFYYSEGII